MKISPLLTGVFAFAMLSSCSSDSINESIGNITEASKGAGAYISVAVSMPIAGSTRSQTTNTGGSNTGVEFGQQEENKVSTLLIVLAKADDKAYIAHTLVDAALTAIDNGTKYKAVGKITKTDLSKFYSSNPTSKDVNVFVFCNPTASLLNKLNDKTARAAWYDAVCTLEEGESVWSDNYFLMSNNSIEKRTFPNTIDDWNDYATEENPFKLSGTNELGGNVSIKNEGTIKVERSVARFDFRDGSKDVEETAELNLPANTYPVVRGTNADGSQGDYIINVKLDKMCLVNMSKRFYFLRRVSDDGLATGSNFQLCGQEYSGNYVVDSDADVKKNMTKDFPTYFNYSLFNKDGELDQPENKGWFISNIDDVIKGKEDNTNKWNDNNKYQRYHIWRYVTENTIPGAENQKNGVSTGVVFKGKLVPTDALKNSMDADDKALYDALSNTKETGRYPETDPIIYLFGGNLYSTWTRLHDHAIKLSHNESTGEWNRTSVLYKVVFGEGGTGKEGDVVAQDESSPNYLWNVWQKANTDEKSTALSNFRKAATKAKITLYQSSKDSEDGWGYYCYYYYWNRHNDNNDNGNMGPMEFGVVRNNVYKLAVTKISQLGHPRNPDNDPDNLTPDSDDERGDVYLSVNCEMLPWVVRVNDIIF